MLYLLGFLCAALVVWNGILLIKIAGMRRAADEICAEVDSRLGRDTNVGIDITISDDKMRRLAAELTGRCEGCVKNIYAICRETES